MEDKFIQHTLLLGGLITFQILLWQEGNSWNIALLGVLIIIGWFCIVHKNISNLNKRLVLFPILSIVFILIFETAWSRIAASLTLSIMIGYSQRRIWRFLWIVLLLFGRNIIETLKFNLKI